MTPHPHALVVALDIDGTLGDYHGHFTRFAEQWTGRPMPDPADINPGKPLWKHLGMSRATYRECKLAFRQGGMKRSMPIYEGTVNAIRHIRRTGVQVWICTSRPYLRLDNIDPDTRHWLRRNGIHKYDGLIYGHRKYRDLVDIVGPERILMVVDDLTEMIEQAYGLGLTCIIRDQPYNRHLDERIEAIRITSNWDIIDQFERLLQERDHREEEAR